MQILMSRVRIDAPEPSYSYRLYVPFTEISPERQSLISMRSDFGLGAGLLARLTDVIAPMSHLEAPPGVEKHRFGTLIDGVADCLGALLLGSAFPEMAERTVPFRLHVPSAPSNATVFARVNNLSGRYSLLSDHLPTLTAEVLGLRIAGER